MRMLSALMACSALFSAIAPVPSAAAAEPAIDVWWPVPNVLLSGTQPLKALLQNTPVWEYRMFWAVDGGQRNPMYDSYQDYPHKEAWIELSGWNWRGEGPYIMHFIATRRDGTVITERQVPIRVAQPQTTAPAPRGAVYYVDPAAGNNANAGTAPASPWKNPPGTRTADNTSFYSSAWGAITTSQKIKCGDTILLKGGATQTASHGGGWRIDNGAWNDGMGWYTPKCPADSPITIRVATASEWPGSAGNFTLNGAGVTATCLAFCGDTHGLVHIQDIDGMTLGGTGAGQRLVIRQAQGPGVTAHNVLITSSWGAPAPTARFLGQWLELAGAKNDGIGIGPAQHFVIRDTIARDNGWSGFSTGHHNDHRVARGAFQDVEAVNNGSRTGYHGDQFLLLGCESCYVIRAKSHDGNLRGLNFGNIGSFNGTDMFLLIRDSEFWHNGLSADNNAVYQSGPCWSGNDNIPTAQQTQRGVMERSIIYGNREGGGPCAYGQGWAEIWNTVWANNGYDKSVGGQGDIAMAGQADTKRLAVYNSIVQKRPTTLPWTATAPSNFGTRRCPVSDHNLYRPVSGNAEILSDFDCAGTNGFSMTAKTFASPPAFMGPNDKIGNAWTIGFAAADDTAYANNDFHLTAGSSAIDGGRFLMRANGSAADAAVIPVLGNGGSNDPRHYFLEPGSYYQAAPDTIQIKGAVCRNAAGELGSPERARITGMTAAAITLDRPCAWPDRAGIHLPWNGHAPDIGAFEFGG